MSLHEAEARLAELEGPKQRFHQARHAHVTLGEELARAKEKFAGHPKLIEALQAAHDEAQALHAAQKAEHEIHAHAFREKGLDLDREIDRAAQTVLDVRGEAHTETGIKRAATVDLKTARLAMGNGE